MADPKPVAPTYAPLPCRAIGDQRLQGIHFRVLGAIAAHDRLSAVREKGQGCWAGNRKLAEECGVNYTNLSAAISDLGKWGYVEKRPHPLNRRMRVFIVNYTSADRAVLKATNPPAAPSSPPPHTLPIDKLSGVMNGVPTNDGLPVGELSDPETGEIVCPVFLDAEKNQGLGSAEYIPRSGEEIRLKPLIDSRERAPLSESAGGVVARFERRFRAGSIPPHELPEWRTWLERQAADRALDDPVGQQCTRLLEETHPEQ